MSIKFNKADIYLLILGIVMIGIGIITYIPILCCTGGALFGWSITGLLINE